MANEEIISDLEAVKGWMEWEMPLNFVVTVEKVINKLKPKKPNVARSTYKCSSCGSRLHSGKGKDKFCHECGQAIDWS